MFDKLGVEHRALEQFSHRIGLSRLGRFATVPQSHSKTHSSQNESPIA
jgi:hypothetical protein